YAAQQAVWSGRGMARLVCISASLAPRRSGRTFGTVKRHTSETLRSLALLALFISGAVLGILLAWSKFGTWKEAGFPGGLRATNLAGYLVGIGFFTFLVCALCVVRLLRYDLRPRRKGRK